MVNNPHPQRFSSATGGAVNQGELVNPDSLGKWLSNGRGGELISVTMC